MATAHKDRVLLARLAEHVEEARSHLRWPDERLYLRVEEISGWTPAQHLDHLVRTTDRILDAVARLEEGDPEASLRPRRPSIPGRAVLWTGWIPRGRGEAPEPTLPEPQPVRQRLRDAMAALSERSRALADRVPSLGDIPGAVEHPLLGTLGARDWIRFAAVHVRHHLAIVADIDRRRAVGAPVASPLEGECGAGAGSP